MGCLLLSLSLTLCVSFFLSLSLNSLPSKKLEISAETVMINGLSLAIPLCGSCCPRVSFTPSLCLFLFLSLCLFLSLSLNSPPFSETRNECWNSYDKWAAGLGLKFSTLVSPTQFHRKPALISVDFRSGAYLWTFLSFTQSFTHSFSQTVCQSHV